MTAFLVAATGTGVGKTFAMRALIHAARQKGGSVAAFKPVISGLEEASAAAPSDTDLLLDALGIAPSEAARAACSGWRFQAPLSPDMAAQREGQAIDFDALVSWSRARMQAADTVFFEGAGGVMAPLGGGYTQRDWMGALACPVVLISGTYLGSISHCLTAIESLSLRGIPLHALVLHASLDAPVAPERMAESLRPHLPASLRICLQPRVEHPSDATAYHLLLREDL